MPVQEINSNYIFTDGEIQSFKVDYQVPTDKGLEIWARVKIKAKHALPHDKFEYCQLELNFASVISMFVAEDFETLDYFRASDDNFFKELLCVRNKRSSSCTRSYYITPTRS